MVLNNTKPCATSSAYVHILQANSEVSALLGRIPSAVGYQPTLATDLGTLQERITTTKKGSITSVQVIIFSAEASCNALSESSWQPEHVLCGGFCMR